MARIGGCRMEQWLGIFARDPVPGRVKTRLAEVIGPEVAAGLYRCFIRDIVDRFSSMKIARTALFWSSEPGSSDPSEASWAPPPLRLRRTSLVREFDGRVAAQIPQEGDDLGVRLRSAFARLFDARLVGDPPRRVRRCRANSVSRSARGLRQAQPALSASKGGSAPLARRAAGFERGAHRAVIIGTDSPTLPTSWVEEAFALLGEADVVLGPAQDGGYYLIGLSRPIPEPFEGIGWGTGAVLEQSLSRLSRGGISHVLLPEFYDVDDMDGLRHLAADLARPEVQCLCPRTWSFMQSHLPDVSAAADPMSDV